MDAANIEYLWHKGEDFIKSGSNIPLIFRMATILDVKPSERVQSRRLWLTAGRDKREKNNQGKNKYKVRKSGGEGSGQAPYRRRPPPGWEHDDRLFDDFKNDGGEGRGRGRMQYKRKSDGGAGDTVMQDAGASGGKKRRRKGKGNKNQQQGGGGEQNQQQGGGEGGAPMPARETISYDDL